MSGLNEQQVLRLLDKKFEDFEGRINAKINASIGRLKIDLEKKINESSANPSNPKNDKQLAIVAKRNAEIAVRDVIEREVMPQFKAFADDMREKTLDGDELVTQYRKRVVGGDAKKLITASASKSPSEFKKNVFVFSEDD